MRSLRPFYQTAQTSHFSLSAELFQTTPQNLLIEFFFKGPVDLIAWPSSQDLESRKNNLWQNTCLEAFFSEKTDPTAPYFEINCSPNGDWNAYRFSSFRTGMEWAENLTIQLKEREATFTEARFQIEVSSNEPLAIQFIGLTAVIEFKNGEKAYWALEHAGSKPDFHDKMTWQHLATH